jgi:hypothetical protein
MYALLTDGSTVEMGPARAQDFEAVRAMHAAMSPDNIYLRFFSMSPGAAEQEAKRVCRKPDSGHAALLAWQGDRAGRRRRLRARREARPRGGGVRRPR